MSATIKKLARVAIETVKLQSWPYVRDFDDEATQVLVDGEVDFEAVVRAILAVAGDDHEPVADLTAMRMSENAKTRMMEIPMLDTETGTWTTFNLPKDVLDAARKVYEWIKLQPAPEQIKLNGLCLAKDLPE